MQEVVEEFFLDADCLTFVELCGGTGVVLEVLLIVLGLEG